MPAVVSADGSRTTAITLATSEASRASRRCTSCWPTPPRAPMTTKVDMQCSLFPDLSPRRWRVARISKTARQQGLNADMIPHTGPVKVERGMANGINQNACAQCLSSSRVCQGYVSHFMAKIKTAPAASQLRADIAQYTQRYSIHDPPSSSEGTSSHAGTTGAATACGGHGAGWGSIWSLR